VSPAVDRARVGRYARGGARWLRLLAARRPPAGIRVSYGVDRIPDEGEIATGGSAKYQRLARRFPNSPARFSILYMGSNGLPPRDLGLLLWIARRRRIPFVLNQDGVAYPAWAGERSDELNRPLRRALVAADHVLYQSEFCKRSADEFLGPARGGWEILPNAVDLDRFTPASEPPSGPPLLLLSGNQRMPHRLELALRTLAALVPELPGARLVVAGQSLVPSRRLIEELGLAGRVSFLGPYAQRDAPALYRSAHLLLHTQLNDACPSAVIEAMACGLPVVHPASGGTVELVGGEGGIGVPHPQGWERLVPPEPAAMAAAVKRVLAELPSYRAAARARAERFGLEAWLDRHEALFRSLLEARAPGRRGSRRPAR
jgi:glycosyltransferase involved in cell wall biosynthesis